MPAAGYQRATELSPPVLGWRKLTLPCQRCFNLHCACVTERAQVEVLRQRVSERHKASLRLARMSDQRAAAVKAHRAAMRRLAS